MITTINTNLMDSRDIFNLTRRTIEWEYDWIHIGTGDDIKKELLSKIFEQHFENSNLIMIKRGRLNSEQIEIESLLNRIINLIGVEDFEVWSDDFKKSIKFNKIGVLNKSKSSV